MAASRPGGLDPTQFGAVTALRTAPGMADPLAASMQSLYLSGGPGAGGGGVGGGYKPGLSATQMAALQVRSGILSASGSVLPRPGRFSVIPEDTRLACVAFTCMCSV